jgi:uncharacterized membrane protein SpoIIM required for sporulation
VTYLSMLLTRARLSMVGARTSSWSDVLRFFTHTFPGALYRLRRWWVACALVNVAFAVGVALWTVNHPEVYTNQLSPAQVQAYVDTDFANYYREFPHHEFATLVWVNNAWVAAQCIAFGVLGLPVLWLLAQNTVNVGVIGALMASHDRTSLFFGLILPHGLLELTAVFVAGATGLRLFWSWVEPGPRTRLQALAAEGRSAVGIALGLVAVLFVSGVIEGFVTPSGLPTWARIGTGVAAELLFVAYVFVVGRRAHHEGATGDLAANEVGDTAPVG